MALHSKGFVGTTAAAALLLMAGCNMPGQPVAPEVVSNPPGSALAELPRGSVTWYQVSFASGDSRVDAEGRRTIGNVAGSMNANPALTATIIGKSDAAGADASNMRLSRQRAMAVRDALVQAGQLRAARVETRWTGERQVEPGRPDGVAETNGRVVDIGVH